MYNVMLACVILMALLNSLNFVCNLVKFIIATCSYLISCLVLHFERQVRCMAIFFQKMKKARYRSLNILWRVAAILLKQGFKLYSDSIQYFLFSHKEELTSNRKGCLDFSVIYSKAFFFFCFFHFCTLPINLESINNYKSNPISNAQLCIF